MKSGKSITEIGESRYDLNGANRAVNLAGICQTQGKYHLADSLQAQVPATESGIESKNNDY